MYLPTYQSTYLPTNTYIHTFIRSVPTVPHPTFSGSHWSSFMSWSLFRSVSVPTEVRSGTHRSLFRYFRRSVPVSCDTPFSALWTLLSCLLRQARHILDRFCFGLRLIQAPNKPAGYHSGSGTCRTKTISYLDISSHFFAQVISSHLL